jgi:hypothetical protein
MIHKETESEKQNGKKKINKMNKISIGDVPGVAPECGKQADILHHELPRDTDGKTGTASTQNQCM